jgi:hypothetical protein
MNCFLRALLKKHFSQIPLLKIVISMWRSHEQQEALRQLGNCIFDILKDHEVRLDNYPEQIRHEVKRLFALGVERVFWGASEKKAKRFAAVIANAIEFAKTEQQFEDAASYIRALDELSEDDMKVLRHLYKHQVALVHEGHQMDSNSFFRGGLVERVMRDVGHLKMQSDEIHARCQRLSGYGLVLQLERRPGEMMVDERAFRITILAKRLVDMLVAVEDIPHS